MVLTAEQYEQIVRQLRSEQQEGRNSERRTSPRAGLRARVRVIPCRTTGQDTILTAWVRDISAQGIGLLLPERLDPNTYLVLSLPTARRKTATLDILFLAVRCDRLPNGQYSVGARFQRLITAEDVQ